jgi:hypothetical protein
LSPFLLLAIVGAAVALAVGAMILVRRLANRDHFVNDTTRASAIFGVVGTSFAVLLAFVMFVAFQSFNDGKEAALEDAASVGALFRTARFFPAEQRDDLQGELACYGRAVVEQEWPAMADAGRSEVVDGWRVAMEDTLMTLPLDSERRRAAYRSLLEERDLRAENRRQRLSDAEPVVSTPVWIILILGGLLTVSFVLLFTDRREDLLVQASLMGVVAAIVTASLLLVWFLDHPFENQNGSIRPVEMERMLQTIEDEAPGLPLPCDAEGSPRPL